MTAWTKISNAEDFAKFVGNLPVEKAREFFSVPEDFPFLMKRVGHKSYEILTKGDVQELSEMIHEPHK